MGDRRQPEFLYEQRLLPLELPPRKAARLYANRLRFLLLILALIVSVMFVLFIFTSFMRQQGAMGGISIVAGGLIGYLLRRWREHPGLRAHLRALVATVIAYVLSEHEDDPRWPAV